MLNNKNAQAIFLGILTTALTRVFGMSTGDSAILGSLILGLSRLYFDIYDWKKSIDLSINNHSEELKLLNSKISNHSPQVESKNNSNKNDVSNDSENKNNTTLVFNFNKDTITASTNGNDANKQEWSLNSNKITEKDKM